MSSELIQQRDRSGSTHFPSTWHTAGSEDGGLAAATLRAVTCGSQLAARFGACALDGVLNVLGRDCWVTRL